MATRIKIRNDIGENWAARNPILAKGEIGLVIDGSLRRAKVGDGITPWNALEFAWEAGGGGANAFADLTDKHSADLPAINTPLAAALANLSAQLSGKAPASGISPAAIAGTAVLTTDPRLSNERVPIDDSVNNAKLADMPGGTVKGRPLSAPGGDPVDLSLSEQAQLLAGVVNATAEDTAPVDSERIPVVSGALVGWLSLSRLWTYIKAKISADNMEGLSSQSTARTNLGAGTTGDALFVAATPAAARETLGVIRRVMASDALATSTTPVSAPDLTFPVEAGKLYRVDLNLIAQSVGAVGYQVTVTYPNNARTGVGYSQTIHNSTAKFPSLGATSTTLNPNTTANPNATLGVSGWIYLRPTAGGNVTFTTAQQTGGAGTVGLITGSMLTVTEL